MPRSDWFSRGLFALGKGRRVRAARKAEIQGDLARAVELFVDADEAEEAARLLIARSDAELDPKQRLVLLGRAISLTKKPSAVQSTARTRRARIFVELAKSGALATGLRHDLRQAAMDLEELGEPAVAAEAFALLGDQEGRARALVAAGAVDELEEVLESDLSADRSSRDLRDGASRVAALIAGGERRAALAACDEILAAHADDAALRDRRETLRAARLVGATLQLVRRDVLRGSEDRARVVLGDSVRIGRSEAEIVLSHPALSRTHVRLYRDPAGKPMIEDLGSRNGTTLRGVRLAGALPVEGTLELRLGGEVPIVLTTTDDATSVRIRVGGIDYLSHLGPTKLAHGEWELVRGPDDWITLRRGATAAFFGTIALGAEAQLLAGDQLATERAGAALFVVER